MNMNNEVLSLVRDIIELVDKYWKPTSKNIDCLSTNKLSGLLKNKSIDDDRQVIRNKSKGAISIENYIVKPDEYIEKVNIKTKHLLEDLYIRNLIEDVTLQDCVDNGWFPARVVNNREMEKITNRPGEPEKIIIENGNVKNSDEENSYHVNVEKLPNNNIKNTIVVDEKPKTKITKTESKTQKNHKEIVELKKKGEKLLGSLKKSKTGKK